MIISTQIVAAVLDAWTFDQNHPHRGREKRPVPDIERLSVFLDVAFRATLVAEEGKAIRGSMTWASESHIYAIEIPRRRDTPLLLKLNSPRPFEPEVIGKLGMATNGATSSLLVDWMDGKPMVWGIIYYGGGQVPLRSIPAGMDEDRHFPPDCLTVRIAGTGSLTITRGHNVIGRIEKGEFRRAIPTPFYSRAMGSYMHNLFGLEVRDGKFAREDDSHRGPLLFHCLEYLLMQLDRRGGGATIAFVPEPSLPSAASVLDTPWGFDGTLEMQRLSAARLRFDQHQRLAGQPSIIVLKADDALSQRLNAIARLAALDGAVVLDEKFEVKAFGCKFRAPAWKEKVIEGPDGFGGGGRSIDFSRLGTRHNSALGFVAAVAGSVAFVASADGPIRGLVKKDDREMLCWADCRVSMFARS